MGFDQITFARDKLRYPLDPWQEWLVIHAGELLPDGRPRFRIVVVLVARQSGKTTVPMVLSAYWQFVEQVPLILGTSTKLDYARESWARAVKQVEKAPALSPLRAKRWTREANGEQESWTREGSRYKIAASNKEGGRSLTVDRLICDELRQHANYSAWDAAEPATAAVRDAQIWCLSNAGDDTSVVLNDLRESALQFIESGEGDYRLGLFEWSAPEDADPTDVHALAQANPNLNRRVDGEALLAKARRAVATGGEALTGFKTENMCQRVKLLASAIEPQAWRDCRDPGELSAVRTRVAVFVDLSPSGQHATLAAAAVLPDKRVRVELVADWTGPSCTDQLRAALPDLLARIKPRVFGWFPSGPAAAIAADVAGITKVPTQAIRSEAAAACMGLAEQVAAKLIAHSGDPLLDSHIGQAERLKRGDAWVFSRRGGGDVDAAYAAAGAVHLARLLPPSVGKPRLIVAGGNA
jgi:phage terminase large subunit-like protein